jgi:FecR protein
MRHLEGWQHRRWSRDLVFHFLFILAAASFAFAQDSSDNNNVRAVRISHVEGTAQLIDDGGVVFDEVHANMPVTEGMRIKTGGDGRVEVQFEDGSVARETPNSVIRFEQLQRTATGDTVTRIEAAAGLSYYEFNNRGGMYTVQVGPYTISTAKSSVFRVGVDENPAQVAVMRGAVHIESGNAGDLDVLTSQTATLDLKDASNYDVAQNITADSWDQWNSDRDQTLAEMGSRATMARAASGSPNDPGWNDLDYYGNWYDVPGYGMGWTPTGAGAGWDPFGSGYWGYYPAYGYTWISGYSWGWWPYHCGAWNWFSGPGWMWFPGNCGWGAYGNGWYAASTIWRYPPNYVLPKRPITPVRGPVHMPPQHALIAVNRDPGTFQFRTAGGSRPVAVPIEFEGKTLHPIETGVHPRIAGPLGDSFTTASGFVPPAHGGVSSGAIVSGSGRTTYLPPPGEMARPVSPASPPAYHPAPAPHYSAPPPMPSAPRMSAPPPPPPAPAGGGARPH